MSDPAPGGSMPVGGGVLGVWGVQGVRRRPHVAVVGGSEVDAGSLRRAEEVGRLLAERGAILVTGGRRGVAEAASRGASQAGGLTVGILPGRSRSEANPWVDVAVPTGLGDTRNALVVMGADAVIAFPGQYGTLSEVAFALLDGTPVIGLGTWRLDRGGAGGAGGSEPQDALDEAIEQAGDPEDAVDRALRRSARA